MSDDFTEVMKLFKEMVTVPLAEALTNRIESLKLENTIIDQKLSAAIKENDELRYNIRRANNLMNAAHEERDYARKDRAKYYDMVSALDKSLFEYEQKFKQLQDQLAKAETINKGKV